MQALRSRLFFDPLGRARTKKKKDPGKPGSFGCGLRVRLEREVHTQPDVAAQLVQVWLGVLAVLGDRSARGAAEEGVLHRPNVIELGHGGRVERRTIDDEALVIARSSGREANRPIRVFVEGLATCR